MNREEFEKLKCGDIVRTMVGGVDELGLEGRVSAILSGPTMDECEIHAHRLHGCDNDPEYLDEWNPEYLEVVDYIHEVTLTDKQVSFIKSALEDYMRHHSGPGWLRTFQAIESTTLSKEFNDRTHAARANYCEILAAFEKWCSRP